jgi:hypothetical protein
LEFCRSSATEPQLMTNWSDKCKDLVIVGKWILPESDRKVKPRTWLNWINRQKKLNCQSSGSQDSRSSKL